MFNKSFNTIHLTRRRGKMNAIRAFQATRPEIESCMIDEDCVVMVSAPKTFPCGRAPCCAAVWTPSITVQRAGAICLGRRGVLRFPQGRQQARKDRRWLSAKTLPWGAKWCTAARSATRVLVGMGTTVPWTMPLIEDEWSARAVSIPRKRLEAAYLYMSVHGQTEVRVSRWGKSLFEVFAAHYVKLSRETGTGMWNHISVLASAPNSCGCGTRR